MEHEQVFLRGLVKPMDPYYCVFVMLAARAHCHYSSRSVLVVTLGFLLLHYLGLGLGMDNN